jgi:hypothetical protein
MTSGLEAEASSIVLVNWRSACLEVIDSSEAVLARKPGQTVAASAALRASPRNATSPIVVCCVEIAGVARRGSCWPFRAGVPFFGAL